MALARGSDGALAQSSRAPVPPTDAFLVFKRSVPLAQYRFGSYGLCVDCSA